MRFDLGLVGWDEEKNGPAPIISLTLNPSMGDRIPGDPQFSWKRLVQERLPEAEEARLFPITNPKGE